DNPSFGTLPPSYRLLKRVGCTHPGDQVLVSCERNTFCRESKLLLADPIRALCGNLCVAFLNCGQTQSTPGAKGAKRIGFALSWRLRITLVAVRQLLACTRSETITFR